MFTPKKAFSGFSVKDVKEAQAFYADTLGLSVHDSGMGLQINLPDGGRVFAYPKPDHTPATFTILNFEVENIDEAVDTLAAKGITFERYFGMPQDEKGILRGRTAHHGPDIAWFLDPSGNIISVLQNEG